MSDGVVLSSRTFNGGPGYAIASTAFGDIFRFDIQTGCRVSSESVAGAECARNQPKINVALLAGNDTLDMDLAPSGDASVAGSVGSDNLKGNPGKDLLDGGDGGDRLDGFTGNDRLGKKPGTT